MHQRVTTRFPVTDALLMALVGLLTLAHGLPGLEQNPPLSYDEGYVLQAPHNLLNRGFYGAWTRDWNLLFDSHISTGPTVLLPVWLSFALFGEGVIQARAVVLVYGALAAAMIYALFRLTQSKGVACLAALLVSLSLYPYHRTVLGEVPGLFWLLLGCWLWLRAVSQGERASHLALAGLAWGAAMLTKLALGPIIVGGLTLCWLLTRWDTSPERPIAKAFWLPLAAALFPLLAWYAIQMVLLGAEAMWDRIATVGAYQPQVARTSTSGVLDNLLALPATFPPGLLPWLAPTIVLILASLLRGIGQGAATLLPLSMWTMCLAYYLASVGWARYGFWAFMLTAAFTAQLFPLLRSVLSVAPPWQQRLLGGAIALALLAPQGIWSWSTLRQGDVSAQEVAQFLQEHATGEETIGSTEWELAFLLRRELQVPPTHVVTVARDVVERSFDWTWPKANWVVTGRIGDFLGAPTRLAADPSFVERSSIRPYKVFQRAVGPPFGWTWSTTGATAVPVTSGNTIGQSFVARHDILTEIRVLLAGGARRTNAPVRLSLYRSPDDPTPLASATLPGSELMENKWYTFSVGKLAVTRGSSYYLELSGEPQAGQTPVTAWYNSSEDFYARGQWYSKRAPQEGDLYFGVLGHNRRER